MKKLFPLILFLLLLSAVQAGAQQSYMQLFDRILEIEDGMLGEFSQSLLSEVIKIKTDLADSPYEDLKTRINIIEHIIRTSMQPEDIGEVIEKEAEQARSQNTLKTFDTWTIISGSISLAATATLTTGILLAESAYDQKVAATTATESKHFQWVTDIFDTVSWISGGVLALGIGSMATLIALRPPSNEITASEKIEIDPVILSAENPDEVIRELMLKRKKLVQLIGEEEAAREKSKFWMNLGLYSGIGSLGSMAVFMVLGLESFYRLNNTYDPAAVHDLEDWSEICQGITIGSGILAVIGFTTYFIIDGNSSGDDLRERLYNLDRMILNYPFR